MRPRAVSREAWVAGLAVALLLGGVLLAYRRAPETRTGTSSGFVASRAAERVRVLSAKSHALGTRAHREVSRYLLEEAAKSPGVQVQLQTAETSYRSWDPFSIATVNNVLARLPGTRGERGVLVVAHYDSTPASPGAADDGSAVAAMLEVLRLMASGPRPRNDLLFLFTDAEEVGMLGANAFLAARTPAERERLSVVLNFDARGDRGPVVMFETSHDNGWLIEQFATASPSPVGNSLASTVYGLLQNDTDFTVFRDAGLNGLNFAYFDGLEAYHTPQESADAVDPHTLQHQGEQMLSLVRRLADEDLSHVARPPVIYFDVLGWFVVHYGHGLGQLLALVCGLGWGGLVLWGTRSGRLRLARCGGGAAAVLGAVGLCALGAWGLWQAVCWAEPRYTLLPGETSPSTQPYLVAFLVLATAVLLGGAQATRRLLTSAELAAGALLPWTLLAVLSTLLLPGTSYFFQWPQLCGLGVLFVLLRVPDLSPRPPSVARGLAPLLLMPSLVLVVPTTRLLYSTFGMKGLALVVALWTLWSSLLVPLLPSLWGAALSWIARLGFTLGCLLLLAAFTQRQFDPAHPSEDSLAYLLDTDRNKAFWVSADPVLDEWTGPILGAGVRREQLEHYLPYVDWNVFVAETDVRDYPAPGLDVLADTREGPRRRLTLRLRARLDPSMLELRITPAKLLGVEVAGRSYGAEELHSAWGRLLFQFWTPAPAGVDMTLLVQPDVPLELELSEVQYGGEATRPLFPRPRPADKSPAPFGWFADSVRVTHTVRR